jgi:hypothetical protein
VPLLVMVLVAALRVGISLMVNGGLCVVGAFGVAR